MSKFVLQPCTLRDAKFVPVKGASPKTLDWAQLLAAFGSNDHQTRMTLRTVRLDSYLGLARDANNPKAIHNFVLFNQDRSARFDWLLQKDPSFANRLVEAYRVDVVQWEVAIKEFDTPGQPPWAT